MLKEHLLRNQDVQESYLESDYDWYEVKHSQQEQPGNGNIGQQEQEVQELVQEPLQEVRELVQEPLQEVRELVQEPLQEQKEERRFLGETRKTR